MESSQESGVDEDTVFIKVGNRGRGRGGSGEGEGMRGRGVGGRGDERERGGRERV